MRLAGFELPEGELNMYSCMNTSTFNVIAHVQQHSVVKNQTWA